MIRGNAASTEMNDSWIFSCERAFRFRSLGHQFTVAVAVKLFRFLDILTHCCVSAPSSLDIYLPSRGWSGKYECPLERHNSETQHNTTPWNRDNSLRWWFIIGRKSVHTIRGISPHLHTLGWQYPDGFGVVYESPPKWGRWVIRSGMLGRELRDVFVY